MGGFMHIKDTVLTKPGEELNKRLTTTFTEQKDSGLTKLVLLIVFES